MPRHGVTYEDVEAAIQALTKAGLTPSIRLIREKVGRGSLSTIAEHKRAFDADQANGPEPALPDLLTAGLVHGARAYWKELVDAAQSQIDAAREQAQTRINELVSERDALKETLAAAQDEIGAQLALIANLETQVAEHIGGIKAQKGQLQEAAVAIARLEAERDSAQALNQSLETGLESDRARLASRESENAALTERLEQRAVENAKDQSMLQTQVSDQKQRIATLQDQLSAASTGWRDTENRCVAAEKSASDATHELEQTRNELKAAKKEVLQLTEQVGELRVARDAKEQVLEQAHDRTEALTTELREAQRTIRRYVDSDRALVDELIQERRQQKAGGG